MVGNLLFTLCLLLLFLAMLTATDVHHLVGLLSRATHPDDVEVEMGNFVWDEATETKRDVDVTITVREGDGSLSVFKGVEVKAHGRKLGSEVVEQLAQKLKDMPEITHRAIVSASGYTKPAMRKAKRHGVELYELKNWEAVHGYDFFGPELVPASRTTCGWSGPTNAHINPSDVVPPSFREELNKNPFIFFESAPDVPQMRIHEWMERMSKVAANELAAKCGPEPKEGTQRSGASVLMRISDSAWVMLGDVKVAIREVRFEGTFERTVQQMPSELKALVKLGESLPMAGCCVSDFNDFLCALIITDGRMLEMAVIPLSERNKKIFQRRLKRASGGCVDINLGGEESAVAEASLNEAR